ncbi:type IV pilus assembly protein PilM [Thermodesulfobacteriota bacterium]
MFPFFKKNPVGIDIGSDSIKIIRLKGLAHNDISIIAQKKIGCEKHGDDLFDSLTKHGLDAISKENDLHHSPCTSVIVSRSLTFHNILLPSMPKEDLIEAVKYETKKELTFPISEAVVDYLVKDEPKTNDEQFKLISISVHKDAVNKHIRFLKDAGFKPMAVEISAVPLVAAFDFNHSWDASKRTALLDIGATKTILIIIKDKSIRFYRDLPVFGSTVTKFFKEKYNLPFDDADEKKINTLGRVEAGEKQNFISDEDFSAIFDKFALELQRSFDYYQAHYREGPVNEVIISGGGALINRLDNFLEDILGVEVTIDNPFKKLYFSNKADEEKYSKIAPIFTTAVGLALRKS